MNWDQLDLTVSGLAAHYQAEDFTPRQLVQHLQSLQPEDRHNIWIERLNSDQLEPYLQRLDHNQSRSLPLYGIPFAIKDNIDLAGIDTSAGCEAFRYRPPEDASVIGRLIAAGAIPMGKTNLDQFATGLVGTRSPYGACKNAFNPKYVSGGSSSGSAVATALGLVSFALGTDTAGSGRVPAAFNNLIGLKPSRGLISAAGVVPACQSLDCVSVFTLTPDDANQVLAVCEGFDTSDPYSRKNTFDNGTRRYGTVPVPQTIGVPKANNLEFFADQQAEQLYHLAVAKFDQAGHEIVEIDITPLMQAARLLYEGPWVTERYLAIQELIDSQPDSLLPVIAEIISQGRNFSSADTFAAMYRLQHFKQLSQQLFEQIDVLITPTAPTCYTIDAVEQDPIALNSRLGTYTNFMNLLDLAAVAVPAGFLASGVGFGITLQAPAFSDRYLLSLANSYCASINCTMGASGKAMPASPFMTPQDPRYVDLVVCGAHLDGMPLNWQLCERGARKISLTRTAANYRLFAMEDGRPALVRDQSGASIEVEVWRLPASAFGSFVADIPPPLGIGKVELDNGDWLPSFIAESRASVEAEDITALGGWRNYIRQSEVNT